jgi:hypothetical protein
MSVPSVEYSEENKGIDNKVSELPVFMLQLMNPKS